MRAPASLLALGLLLGGCIIYETDDGHGDCRGDRCVDDTAPPWTPPGDDDDDTDTDTDAPDPAPQLTLSATEAERGQALIVWIQADVPDFDFTKIDGVLFTGDAKVVQTEIRKREAFLLVDVPCGAALGKTPVVVELDNGSDVLVSGGFTILDATSPGVCDCDN